MFCDDTAPAPARTQQQRAATQGLEEVTTRPNWPLRSQRAAREKVIGGSPGGCARVRMAERGRQLMDGGQAAGDGAGGGWAAPEHRDGPFELPRLAPFVATPRAQGGRAVRARRLLPSAGDLEAHGEGAVAAQRGDVAVEGAQPDQPPAESRKPR